MALSKDWTSYSFWACHLSRITQKSSYSFEGEVVRQSHFYTFALCLLFTACASEPKKEGPDWIRQPTRTVDNGYIVYVGTGDSRDSERAQLRAEGMALEDLANECSFIPKGARLEDRYIVKGKSENTAYVKVAVEFQECTEAQKALEPSDIRKLANTSFTEQLRRFQDLEETGELPDKSEYAVLDMPAEVQPPPTMQPGVSDSVHFAVMRQYVAYQKQVVILAPPTVYPPNSPASRTFVTDLQPTVGQIQQTAAANPALVKNPQPWSKIYDRPHVTRPAVLAPHHQSGYKSALPYIHQNDVIKGRNKGSKKRRRGGRHGGEAREGGR